jgi:polysaccharide pyruvyl transferase CsaB
MAEMLIDRGFDPSRIFTLYNGVDFRQKPRFVDRSEFCARVGLQVGPEHVVFGIAARLSAVKDIQTLIRAFSVVQQSCSNAKLLIAGDGEQRQELEQLAERLCPAGSYSFAGWVQDTDSFYNAIDVNMLTSLSEGFPYALPEGARLSCATISTRVGGIPALIEHGVTGLLFEPGDVETLTSHMVGLATDTALRTKLGNALYEKTLREFSLDAMVQKQLAIYETLLRRASRPKARRDGVLICGAYGRGNAGDDSILEAILKQLRDIDPDIPVHVLSRNPKETRRRYRVGSVHLFNIPAFLHRMRRTRLYINGGGSLIQDATSTRSLRYYLANISFAKRCGNRVLMYGCGIGPVSVPGNRKKAGRVIDRCADLITLRETGSVDELRAMGVNRPEIRVTADPALLLDPARPESVDGYLTTHGLDVSGKYAMFVLRPWPGFEKKVEDIAAAAETLHRTHGLTPVFLALEPGKDLEVSRIVAGKIQCPHHVLAAPDDGHMIVGLMGRMQVVISMRLHALIFASGQGTPLVGIVYDPKVSGFLNYLEQKRYVDLADVTQECLVAMAEEGLREGPNFGRADRLRELAMRNGDAARELLDL